MDVGTEWRRADPGPLTLTQDIHGSTVDRRDVGERESAPISKLRRPLSFRSVAASAYETRTVRLDLWAYTPADRSRVAATDPATMAASSPMPTKVADLRVRMKWTPAK